jgi:excisionase family DNA binding protein
VFDFLKPREVAKILGVERNTVYWWIRKGRLPAVQVGGTMRIMRKDVRRLSRNTRKRGRRK